MTYKKMTKSEWIEIGNQSKKVKREIYKLMDMSYGKMPVNIVDILFKCEEHLNHFNGKAETRMFKDGASNSTDVFFGERPYKSEKVRNDERW